MRASTSTTLRRTTKGMMAALARSPLPETWRSCPTYSIRSRMHHKMAANTTHRSSRTTPRPTMPVAR